MTPLPAATAAAADPAAVALSAMPMPPASPSSLAALLSAPPPSPPPPPASSPPAVDPLALTVLHQRPDGPVDELARHAVEAMDQWEHATQHARTHPPVDPHAHAAETAGVAHALALSEAAAAVAATPATIAVDPLLGGSGGADVDAVLANSLYAAFQMGFADVAASSAAADAAPGDPGMAPAGTGRPGADGAASFALTTQETAILPFLDNGQFDLAAAAAAAASTAATAAAAAERTSTAAAALDALDAVAAAAPAAPHATLFDAYLMPYVPHTGLYAPLGLPPATVDPSAVVAPFVDPNAVTARPTAPAPPDETAQDPAAPTPVTPAPPAPPASEAFRAPPVRAPARSAQPATPSPGASASTAASTNSAKSKSHAAFTAPPPPPSEPIMRTRRWRREHPDAVDDAAPSWHTPAPRRSWLLTPTTALPPTPPARAPGGSRSRSKTHTQTAAATPAVPATVAAAAAPSPEASPRASSAGPSAGPLAAAASSAATTPSMPPPRRPPPAIPAPAAPARPAIPAAFAPAVYTLDLELPSSSTAAASTTTDSSDADSDMSAMPRAAVPATSLRGTAAPRRGRVLSDASSEDFDVSEDSESSSEVSSDSTPGWPAGRRRSVAAARRRGAAAAREQRRAAGRASVAARRATTAAAKQSAAVAPASTPAGDPLSMSQTSAAAAATPAVATPATATTVAAAKSTPAATPIATFAATAAPTVATAAVAATSVAIHSATSTPVAVATAAAAAAVARAPPQKAVVAEARPPDTAVTRVPPQDTAQKNQEATFAAAAAATLAETAAARHLPPPLPFDPNHGPIHERRGLVAKSTAPFLSGKRQDESPVHLSMGRGTKSIRTTPDPTGATASEVYGYILAGFEFGVPRLPNTPVIRMPSDGGGRSVDRGDHANDSADDSAAGDSDGGLGALSPPPSDIDDIALDRLLQAPPADTSSSSEELEEASASESDSAPDRAAASSAVASPAALLPAADPDAAEDPALVWRPDVVAQHVSPAIVAQVRQKALIVLGLLDMTSRDLQAAYERSIETAHPAHEHEDVADEEDNDGSGSGSGSSRHGSDTSEESDGMDDRFEKPMFLQQWEQETVHVFNDLLIHLWTRTPPTPTVPFLLVEVLRCARTVVSQDYTRVAPRALQRLIADMDLAYHVVLSYVPPPTATALTLPPPSPPRIDMRLVTFDEVKRMGSPDSVRRNMSRIMASGGPALLRRIDVLDRSTQGRATTQHAPMYADDRRAVQTSLLQRGEAIRGAAAAHRDWARRVAAAAKAAKAYRQEEAAACRAMRRWWNQTWRVDQLRDLQDAIRAQWALAQAVVGKAVRAARHRRELEARSHVMGRALQRSQQLMRAEFDAAAVSLLSSESEDAGEDHVADENDMDDETDDGDDDDDDATDSEPVTPPRPMAAVAARAHATRAATDPDTSGRTHRKRRTWMRIRGDMAASDTDDDTDSDTIDDDPLDLDLDAFRAFKRAKMAQQDADESDESASSAATTAGVPAPRADSADSKSDSETESEMGAQKPQRVMVTTRAAPHTPDASSPHRARMTAKTAATTTAAGACPVDAESDSEHDEVHRLMKAESQMVASTTATAYPNLPVPSQLLCGTLRPYQVSGMSWICRLYELGRNGILADEMGLGKTIQTIAAIAWLAERRQIWGPHLVVAPTSVVGNWVMEFQRWAPGLRVVAYTGSKKERAALRSGWTKPEHSDVVVTSYTLVLNDLAHLRRRRWVYLVVDEAHHIKNETSQAWRALMELPVLAKLLLTGTPFQNSLHELWSLLYFLSSSQEMRDRFTAEEWQAMTTPIADVNAAAPGSLDEESADALARRREQHAAAKRMIAGVHTLLRPYILRRLKSEVEQELPQKRYLIHVCPMSRMQRQLYTDFIAHHATRDKLQSRRPFSVIQCLAYLRQVCNHPYLITPPQPRSPVFLDFDAMPARSAMLERCFRIIDHTTAATAGTAVAMLFGILSLFAPLEWPTEDVRGGVRNRCAAAVRIGETAATSALEDAAAAFGALAARHRRHLPQRHPRHDAPWSLVQVLARQRGVAAAHRAAVYTRAARRHRAHAWITAALAPLAALDDQWAFWRLLRHAVQPCASPRHAGIDWTRAVDAPAVPATYHVVVPRVLVRAPARPAAAWLSPSGARAAAAWKARLEAATAPPPPLVAFPTRDALLFDCGKLQVLAKLLARLRQTGHRCLIFTQMPRVLDLLELFLSASGYRYMRMDGSTPAAMRTTLVDGFNADPRFFCFILSTRSGGVGLNLTGADTVIFYDSDWNPAMDAQAQDRAHRIGQTREVTIYRLITAHSIEANILRKAEEKQRLSQLVIGAGHFTTDALAAMTRADWLDPAMLFSQDDPRDGQRQRDFSEIDEILFQATGGHGVTRATAAAAAAAAVDGDVQAENGARDNGNDNNDDDDGDPSRSCGLIDDYMLRHVLYELQQDLESATAARAAVAGEEEIPAPTLNVTMADFELPADDATAAPRRAC